MSQRMGLGLLLATAVALAIWATSRLVDWSRPSAVADAEVAYVCLETHELVYGPVQPVPALNPKTGRRTLVPAVYSVQDESWVAAPPEAVLRRQQRELAGEEDRAPLRFAPPEEDLESE